MQSPNENLIKSLIELIGDDPSRDGLLDTPSRVIRSYKELFSGYKQNPEDLITTFDNEEKYDEVVLSANISVFSTCEHHLLPFYGIAHVAYLPDQEWIIGISKLARLVEIFSRRLQVQERLCQQITKALMTQFKARGAACIIKATHLCQVARGVKKEDAIMVTSSLEGVFRHSPSARSELFDLIKLAGGK